MIRFNTKRLEQGLLKAAGFLLLVAVFVIDLATPIGVADGFLYVGVLFLFIMVSDAVLIGLGGMIAISLVVAGYFISPRNTTLDIGSIAVTNRIFSIVVLILTDLLIIKYRWSLAVLSVKMQELKDYKHALDEAAMVAITDESGKVLKVNDKFCEVSGYAREDLIGKDHTIINSGVHAKKFIEELDSSVASKKTLKGEFINRAKDGSFYWLDTTIVPFVNDEGNIYQYVAMGFDITVRKRIEEQMIRQKEELEKFLYISSHDLQEPLRKIQTFTNLIREKEEDRLSDTGKKYIERLQVSVKRIRHLVQDFVTYSDFNKSVYKFEPADLAAITEKVKEDLKDVIRQKNAVIEYQGKYHPSVIYFQFYQLILNLVSNAIKFSRPGVPPHIVIKCRLSKGADEPWQLLPGEYFCHITVQDNGIGFSANEKSKIFQIFRTLPHAEKFSGIGMGLAIVKRIVDNHKGVIVASGEENKGATFDIFIPAPEAAFTLEKEIEPRSSEDQHQHLYQ